MYTYIAETKFFQLRSSQDGENEKIKQWPAPTDTSTIQLYLRLGAQSRRGGRKLGKARRTISVL